MILLSIVEMFIIRSKVGRAFQSIREDQIAAGSCGVDLTGTKVLAFALSAMFGGMAGCIYAPVASYISPDTFSYDQSVVFFSMVLIGGSGTILGPVIGAIIYTIIPELMRSFKDIYMALVGVGIVFLVLFLPRGITPLFMKDGKIWRWLQANRPKRAPDAKGGAR